jgi:outer membrane protein assembly factor BamB
VVYRGYLYLGHYNGNVRCFNAETGEEVFNKRVSNRSGIISSLVAADGKIYCAAEDGTVHVLAAGAEFKILASNALGAPCFATPAISKGVLYFRTTKDLIAVE